MINRRLRQLANVLLGLFAVLPVVAWILAFVALMILRHHGCQIDEAGTHACTMMGADLSEAAYEIGVFCAWWPIVAFPLALCVAVIWCFARLALAVFREDDVPPAPGAGN